MSLYDDASLIMFPSGYKEDKIYSLKPTDGSGDLTFTRASTATRVNAEGLIETSPVNFLQQSNTFNTTWANAGATLTSGQTDPNGGSNAWKVELAAAANAYLGQFGIGQIGVVTISAYLRADSEITIGFSDGSTNANSITIGTTWQRYEFSYLVSGSQCNIQIDNYFGVSPANLAKTFYIYGTQLNIGTTAKPYFPTTDRLDVPRIDYTGGGCGKLLLESQRTNFALYSEQLDNAYWLKYQCSITANQAVSPDGTQNADLFTATASGDNVIYRGGFATRVLSFFVKAGTLSASTKFYIAVDGVGNAKWNQDGTINSQTGGTATNGVSYGNGWYRFTFIVGGGSVANFGLSNSTSGDTLFVYGIQAEEGTYVSSYIPTLASSVTRLADAVSKTGISSLIGQTEGTIYAEINFDLTVTASGDTRFQLSDGTGLNWIFLGIPDGSYFNRVRMYTNGPSGEMSAFSSNSLTSGVNKIAFGYKSGSFVLYINGTQAASSSSTITVPACSRVDLQGNGPTLPSATERTNYNQAILFKTRLTNDQLADMTGGNITTFNALATLYGYTIL